MAKKPGESRGELTVPACRYHGTDTASPVAKRKLQNLCMPETVYDRPGKMMRIVFGMALLMKPPGMAQYGRKYA
jgi:hypothetical protein